MFRQIQGSVLAEVTASGDNYDFCFPPQSARQGHLGADSDATTTALQQAHSRCCQYNMIFYWNENSKKEKILMQLCFIVMRNVFLVTKKPTETIDLSYTHAHHTHMHRHKRWHETIQHVQVAERQDVASLSELPAQCILHKSDMKWKKHT